MPWCFACWKLCGVPAENRNTLPIIGMSRGVMRREHVAGGRAGGGVRSANAIVCLRGSKRSRIAMVLT